jgi:hypothetical protein
MGRHISIGSMDAGQGETPIVARLLDYRRPVEREYVKPSCVEARLQRFEAFPVSEATFRFVDRQKPEKPNVVACNPEILQVGTKRIRTADQEVVERRASHPRLPDWKCVTNIETFAVVVVHDRCKGFD